LRILERRYYLLLITGIQRLRLNFHRTFQYITVGDSGATTLTFNATSIQNAVILGLFILVLGALVLPLFGVSMGDYLGEESGSGYGYGYEQPA
jgi:uncharacterized YccA/Bax inhibitor family protein